MVSTLEPREDGFAVCGDLTAATVPDLHRRAVALLSGSGPLTIDLARVVRADSAGVALLVEWLRLTRAQDRPLVLANTPEQMVAIVRVAGLERLLPLGAGLPGVGLPVEPVAAAYPSSTELTRKPS